MNWYLKVLKQYTDFDGRARRKEYWMFTLFSSLISYGLQGIGIALESGVFAMIAGVYGLAVLVPTIAVAIRRMHDVGKSGWYILIPIYNLILACTDSVDGPNEYGDNPKGLGNDKSIDQIGVE